MADRTLGLSGLFGPAGLFALFGLFACAGAPDQRALLRDSRSVAKSDTLDDWLVPGVASSVDRSAVDDAWREGLKKPTSARPEALLSFGGGRYVEVVWTDDGWRLAENPLELHGQGTPRQALWTFVRASRDEDWERMVELAPARFRAGLSPDDLENAWTQGAQGEALREARDRIADHLADPIIRDADEAILVIDDEDRVRLEREGARWVITDF